MLMLRLLFEVMNLEPRELGTSPVVLLDEIKPKPEPLLVKSERFPVLELGYNAFLLSMDEAYFLCM